MDTAGATAPVPPPSAKAGWLGADVGRGAAFCEAGRDWLVRQPANTFSNAGFVTAGLLIGWHAGLRHDEASTLSAHRHLATVVGCLVVLLAEILDEGIEARLLPNLCTVVYLCD